MTPVRSTAEELGIACFGELIGAVSVVQTNVPRTFLEPLLRLAGAESMFTTHLDARAREHYQDRIAPPSHRPTEREPTRR